MRNYLLVGKPDPALAAALPLFEEAGGFRCSQIIGTEDVRWTTIQVSPPELVLVNLDASALDWMEVVAKLNHYLGHIPNYIGLTSSHKMGFEAYKAGFANVILTPCDTEEVVAALNAYKYSSRIQKSYCIAWYNDYHYVNLDDIVLVKAASDTCEFIMKDGSTIHNFQNLKSTYQSLPTHFQRIHRSWVVNSHFVYRINMRKSRVYLRNYKDPIPFTKRYKMNLITLKKLLSQPSFILFQ